MPFRQKTMRDLPKGKTYEEDLQMSKKGNFKRLLSVILAVAMCLTFVPVGAFAAEGDTAVYTKISTVDELTTGQYVMVVSTGYAPGVLDGSWVTAVQPTIEGDTVTNANGGVWTITVNGDGTVKLTDANGVTIAPKSGNTNGIQAADYSWAVACANGTFAFKGQGEDTTILASNKGSENKFRAYKNATVAGNPSGYPSEFTLYKLTESTVVDPSEVPSETPSETPSEAPSEPETTVPSEPEAPVVSTIAEAKAMASGTESITVSGTVIFVDGKNVVVQDATGGINLYFNTAPTDIAVGNVVTATGKRAAYKGLEQLSGVSEYTVSGTAELPAQEVTIADILADQDTAALESTRVLIKGAVVGETNGNNIPLTQGDATINLYKAPTLEGIAAGDTVDVYAVIGDFNGYQLRVAAAADVTKVTTQEPAAPWAGVDAKYSVYEAVSTLANGDVVVIYNPTNAKALSSETANSYHKAGVEAAVVGENYIASDSDYIEWTVSIDENGVYGFTQGDLKLGIEKSGTYLNLKTNAGDYGFTVEPYAEGSDLSIIYSATVEGSYGHAYLEWYADKNAFSVYSTGTDRLTEEAFGFTFYKLVREGVKEEEPETPVEPEEPTTATWTQTTLAEITENDTIAITMTKDGTTWVLPVTGEGGSGQPLATYTGTIDGTTLTTDEAAAYSWTITAADGGYYIQNADGAYLYLTATNNGMRIGDTAAVWTIDQEYLASVDSKGDTRYLGVYNSQDWRCYKNTTGNTAGQTLGLWKLNVEEEPTGIADGTYVIWNPAYGMALSTSYNGYYNNGVAVTETDGVLSGYSAAEIWTVTNNEDGTITIATASGDKLAMGASYSSMPLNDVNDTWVLEATADGLWNVKNAVRGNYIEWYADKSNWSSYGTIYDDSKDLFALKFTPAVVEEEPEEPTGIADGNYVIWAPAYSMALSSVYSGYYNSGVAVTETDSVLSGYSAAEIWTVTNNGDGTYSIAFGGQDLGMADSYSSMTLGAKHNVWTLEEAADGLWYVKNVGRECYIEWYDSKSYWSGYGTINESSEGMFALRFTPVEPITVTDPAVVQGIAQWGGMTVSENTDKVYGDKFIVGDEKDTNAIYTAVVNGAVVTPWTQGGKDPNFLYYMGGKGLGSGTNDYMQLQVSSAGWGDMELSFRLRASNSGAGEFTLQYSADGVNFTNFTTGTYSYKWTQWGKNEAGESVVVDSGVSTGTITDGIAKTSLAPGEYVEFSFDVPTGADNAENLYIRLVPGTTKANGKDGTIGATSTVRFDNVILSGSPVVDSTVTSYVTVTPNGEEDQPVGTALTMESEAGATIYYSVNGGEFQVYDPENKPVLETLPCDIEVYATVEGKTPSAKVLYHYAAGTVSNVKLEPNGGGIYISGESRDITLTCATEGATIYYMTSENGETWPDEWTEYTAPITLEKGFGKLYVKAYAAKDGFTDSAEVTRTFTERTTDTYSLYFGQLHSHTNISDGAGSIQEAYEHASKTDHIDFLAVTDHSNAFDNADAGSLADGSVSKEWVEAQETALQYTTDTFVGLYGYEMTWSNGLGHMNTFNTDGFQSRTQSQFSNYGSGLQNYYAALKTDSDSISQFNHPGTTFGDFSDFAHYDESIDQLITLIEVGNGEGAIGSSGYFPSYEYYTRALDKGWHVAPTNNQDNHKGNWGSSNTGRTVVLADSLTAEGIYDALRNYRVYATEDNDLNIYYSLNGNPIGSILELDSGDELTLTVALSDATDASIGKVEVIVNGGLTAASQTVSGNAETVTFTLSNDYAYYYIKVTQADGDIAVTAPVWTGDVEAAGIASFTTDTALPVQGKALDLTLNLYNNEPTAMEIQEITFTIGDEVIHTADLKDLTQIKANSTATYTFSYTHDGLGDTEVYANVTAMLNGVEKVYREKLDLNYVTPSMVTNVIVDGTHYNDYVSGYYGGNVNNLASIAADSQIDVTVVTDEITPEMLASCNLLIISAPARKAYSNYGVPEAKPFEDAFIAMVADYVKNGGSVLVCGLADYQDKNASAENHTSAQLNKLLEAIGSTMRINDDEAYDDVNFSNQNYRLYPTTFNAESPWTAGIAEEQKYSQYSGCTVDVGSGMWVVKGFDTTYSIDSDGDGLGGVAKGEAVFLAAEETPYGGNIFAAGGVFVSDFEVQAEMDNIWSLPYANRTIIENIMGAVRTELPLSTIAQVRAAEEDEVFRIRGYVTAGTANENNKFFDAIYVQDETGGITVFPFAELGVPVGTPIEIVGYVDEYQGDKEIQIMSYKILDAEPHIYEPEKMSNKDAMDYATNGGELIQVEGEVVEVIYSGDTGVAQFVVKDSKGDLAKVFIDGYILSGTTGKNTLASIVKKGNTVSAVGLLYMHPEGDSDVSVAVLRVRDCDEVKLIKAGTTSGGNGGNANTGDNAILGFGLVMLAAMLTLAVLVPQRKRYFEK